MCVDGTAISRIYFASIFGPLSLLGCAADDDAAADEIDISGNGVGAWSDVLVLDGREGDSVRMSSRLEFALV